MGIDGEAGRGLGQETGFGILVWAGLRWACFLPNFLSTTNFPLPPTPTLPAHPSLLLPVPSMIYFDFDWLVGWTVGWDRVWWFMKN